MGERSRSAVMDPYEAMFASSPIGMALVGLGGGWIEVNDAVCRITGLEREELLARDFQSITHPDDLDTDLGLLGELLAGIIPSYQLHKRYVRPDGSYVWVLLSVTLVREDDGRPLHFLSQIVDVDAQVRAEQQWRTAFEASPIGMVMVGPYSVCLDANDAFLALLDRPRSDVVGHRLMGLTHPDDLEVTLEHVLDTVGEQRTFEKRFLRGDGSSVWVAVTTIAAHHEGQGVQLSHVRDITAERAAREALADRAAVLERTNQLKSDLLGMLGHEIGNPLTVLGMACDLAERGWGAQGEGPEQRFLALVRRTAGQLQATVEEVLTLVLSDAGELRADRRVVDLAGVLGLFVASLGSSATVTCGPGTSVLVQPRHLEQVLANLVSNATKYGGGAVSVSATREGDRVLVSVVDEGAGVPEGFEDRLFDRFARGDGAAAAPGTGLGLHIARELARANGGDLVHTRTPGGGATFTLALEAAPV